MSKAMDSIIESSDDFYNDIYTDSLSRIMVSINKLIYSNYFSKKIFQTMSNDEIDVLMEDFVDEGLFIDIYDFKFRNDAVLGYNVEDKLENIKAKALIFAYPDDLYFTPEFDTIPLKEILPDSKVIVVKSNRDVTGYDDYSVLILDEVREFLKTV
jgi:homoserine O-acetyltransferase